MANKEDIVFDKDAPLTICKVENGYKVILAREMHAYDRGYVESNRQSLRIGEYVFSNLEDAYGFFKRHFE